MDYTENYLFHTSDNSLSLNSLKRVDTNSAFAVLRVSLCISEQHTLIKLYIPIMYLSIKWYVVRIMY